MIEQKKIRLSALARTYNVGVHNLVELLEKKNLTGEGVNPNTIVNKLQAEALEKEFGGARTEKVDIRQVLRATTETVAATAVPEKEESAPQELTLKSNVIFNTPIPEISGPKIMGKIDLDKLPNAESAQEEKEVAAQDETVDSVTPVAPAKQPTELTAEAIKESTKEVTENISQSEVEIAAAPKDQKAAVEEVQEEKSAQKSDRKNEVAAPAPAPAEVAEVSPTETAPRVIKVKNEPAKVVEHKSQVKAKEEIKTTKMEPKAAPKVAVKEETKAATTPEREDGVGADGLFRANTTERLSGPKILGTMVLPVAGNASRGKRNRIKKNKVDIATTPGAARPATGTGAANTSRGAYPQGNASRGGASRPGAAKARPAVKAEVSDVDVQNQIKETLARLTGKGNKTKSSKYRRDKRDAVHGRLAEEAQRAERDSDTLQVTEFVTVSELATMMDVSVNEVIAACMNLGLMVSINQRLDAEALAIVAEEFGFKVEFVAVEIQEAIDTEEDKPEDLISRPPIVTVMGHVDHGKTSLLDYIRKANVIAGEAGGITQHIGAYSVKLDDGRRVTFLDTPGHEAFTAMRARGAKVTDVAIIIIAADDAIMPQTLEAINHAAAAGVPIVFAINKVDKPSANPDRIKEQLSAMNYLVEDWGGKYQSEDISAKSGLNVDKLLEKIVLESELLELKANPNRKASGSVIESTLDKGRGYVTTILVQNGTLRMGDVILSGIYTGRVKAMFNERGKKITEAGPASPVLVLGLNGAPQAGDLFNVMDDDKAAREIATKREQLQRMQGLRTQKHITLDEIGRRIAIGSFKELNIIVKGDVDGSIEALTDSLIKLSTEEVQVNVIHKAVGAISESDVLLAAASNAIIIGFQVRPATAARRIAEKEEIDIRLYSIIYDAINEIKDAIEGMLAPETKEEITASVEVIETFKITKVGTVAGCIVREGKIVRGAKVRVIRDGIVIFTGKLNSLKRFKEEVKDVAVNTECGLAIESYNDIKAGDIVESYTQVEVARKL
ncbi:MAG: translation initiation factor IF-2 [Mucinivorans sp.]